MAIYKYLDANTGHVTQEDLRKLAERYDYITRDFEEGLMVHVRENADFTGLSIQFMELFQYAKKNGCTWINLDRDGDIIDELAFKEW